MLTAVGLLLAMQVAGENQYEHPTHEEMQARLESCGFEQVVPVFDDILQSDVVLVMDKDAADEQVMCAAKALDHTAYIPEFGPNIAGRYYEFATEIMRPRAIAMANAYFAVRKEMGKPPLRQPDESDFALAKRIETFCGQDASGAFTDEFGGVVVSPDWISQGLQGSQNFDNYSAALECLMHAITLADLEFGFVGNERAAVGDPAVAEPAETSPTE